MTEEVKAEAKIEIPSSKDSREEAHQPQAEQVIAAAIQTGAAAERTEKAAAEATAAALTAEQVLAQLRESLKPDLEAINERLKNLEEMEAEELTIQEEQEGTPTLASANVVEIEEPTKPPDTAQTKQDAQPEKRPARGGFLKRVLLNS